MVLPFECVRVREFAFSNYHENKYEQLAIEFGL